VPQYPADERAAVLLERIRSKQVGTPSGLYAAYLESAGRKLEVAETPPSLIHSCQAASVAAVY
jgi:hypothetical protein